MTGSGKSFVTADGITFNGALLLVGVGATSDLGSVNEGGLVDVCVAAFGDVGIVVFATLSLETSSAVVLVTVGAGAS